MSTNKTDFLDRSANLAIQILSLFLWALALAGLEIKPEETATGIVNHINSNNFVLLAILVGNVGLVAYKWIRTWQTDKPNFTAFLKSLNWWTSFANIAGAILLSYDIVIPDGTLQLAAQYIFQEKYWEMAGLLLVNLVPAIVKRITQGNPGEAPTVEKKTISQN